MSRPSEPPLDSAFLEAAASDALAEGPIAEHCVHNLTYWRWIHGSLGMLREREPSFAPRADYWLLTERRALVAYFSHRFEQAFAPAEALRHLAVETFRHFDAARRDGRFGDPALATMESGLWRDLGPSLLDVARRMPDVESYEALRRAWRKVKAPTLREDLVDFLDSALEKESVENVEPRFLRRVPWFPYLGIQSRDELPERQRLIYSLVLLFTSTNAYHNGGSLSFAPVLQNNPAGELITHARRWSEGEDLQQTGFAARGRKDVVDRRNHSPVVELWGFLNLQRMPFYNRAAAGYAGMVNANLAERREVLRRIGVQTRRYLEEHGETTRRLASALRSQCREPTRDPSLVMEGIRLDSVAKQYPEDVEKQADKWLMEEVLRRAREVADGLSDLDAASVLLHLALDGRIYFEYRKEPAAAPQTPVVREAPPDAPYDPATASSGPSVTLPTALAQVAHDALGYLGAGHHVLLAGPPGTGKTTVAQFVGHAWNAGRSEVAEELPLEELPPTTVGNSAWAPFHTIGGIVPGENGRFVAHRGIFIDPEGESDEAWQLRPGCLVLDEMNRADLDRCIGELYPLLSRSVANVRPAGIPGVRAIRQHPRFRLVATVNDTTLDDVVFPISEGLARRFVRLEMPGASREDLDAYFGQAAAVPERMEAVHEVLNVLFEACTQEELVHEGQAGVVHLPFGVGYFETLRAWAAEQLILSPQFRELEVNDQARTVLRTALLNAARARRMLRVLERLVEPEVSE